MRRFLTTLMLGAALCAPVVMHAEDHPKRYYDRDKRDYHEWNETENRAYRHWLQDERHRTYHPWAKAGKVEQRDYWRWRHDHADWH
jgi:predicted acetyltransferase